MPANPDASRLLKISFAEPREGSCLTPEVLAEIASLLRITLPESSTAGAPCTSKDSNNLASLDAENCILVPAAILYREEQTWDVSSGGDLDFEDFKDQGIDATKAFFNCYLLVDSAEAGKDVQEDPGPGTVNVRPSYEIVTLTADKITIAVKNASSDVVVVIQLLKLPVPPEPS